MIWWYAVYALLVAEVAALALLSMPMPVMLKGFVMSVVRFPIKFFAFQIVVCVCVYVCAYADMCPFM